MKLDVLNIINDSISEFIPHMTSSNLCRQLHLFFFFSALSLFIYCNSPLSRRFKVYVSSTLHPVYILLSFILLRLLTVIHMSLTPFESKRRKKVADRNITVILNVECMWTYPGDNIPKFIFSLNYKILTLLLYCVD